MIKIIQLFFLIRKITLDVWIRLEDKKEEIAKVDDDFPQHIFDYLHTAFGFGWIWQKLRWQTVAEIMMVVNHIASPKNKSLPLLNSKPSKKDNTPDWDYKGRTINYWSHLFAKEYGWSLEYIKKLNPDKALALLQEIMTSDQLAKEFQWGMSEVAYSYNATTKKSDFNRLPRPDWMLPDANDIVIKPIRIRTSHLPVGVVITPDEILKSQTPKPE